MIDFTLFIAYINPSTVTEQRKETTRIHQEIVVGIYVMEFASNLNGSSILISKWMHFGRYARTIE